MHISGKTIYYYSEHIFRIFESLLQISIRKLWLQSETHKPSSMAIAFKLHVYLLFSDKCNDDPDG